MACSGCDTNAFQERLDPDGVRRRNAPIHLSVLQELHEVTSALISTLKCKIDSQVSGSALLSITFRRQGGL